MSSLHMSALDKAKAAVARLEYDAQPVEFTRGERTTLREVATALGYVHGTPTAMAILKTITALTDRIAALEQAAKRSTPPYLHGNGNYCSTAWGNNGGRS